MAARWTLLAACAMHVLCEAPFGLREGRKTVLRDAGIDGDGEVFGAEDWERVVQTFCVERVHLGRHKSFLSSWKSDYVTSSPRAAEQCCPLDGLTVRVTATNRDQTVINSAEIPDLGPKIAPAAPYSATDLSSLATY